MSIGNDEPQSPTELYDGILSRIDFTTQTIKSLASSEQYIQNTNPEQKQKLIDQCNDLCEETQIGNISKTIQLLDHYRGVLRIKI